jgi:hypothetical protein
MILFDIAENTRKQLCIVLTTGTDDGLLTKARKNMKQAMQKSRSIILIRYSPLLDAKYTFQLSAAHLLSYLDAGRLARSQ